MIDSKLLFVSSLYGNKDKYVLNSIVNAILLPYIYPGWSFRLYCHGSVNTIVQKTLSDLGVELIIKDDSYQTEQEIINYCQMWRLEPLGDESVDRFIVRDMDSVINTKEAWAVNEWMQTDKSVHLLHDHEKHNNCLILAGMFGSKGGVIKNYAEIMNTFLSNHDPKVWRGLDQVFLRDHLWPLISTDKDYIAHGQADHIDWIPFPSETQFDYIFEWLHHIGQRNNKLFSI
jgi:hypothetical protein